MSSMVSSNVTDSGMSETSEPLNTLLSDSITSTNNHLSLQQLSGSGVQTQQSALSTANTGSSGVEQGHSRNSSNTSQVSVQKFEKSIFYIVFVWIQLKFSKISLGTDVKRIWLQ